MMMRVIDLEVDNDDILYRRNRQVKIVEIADAASGASSIKNKVNKH